MSEATQAMQRGYDRGGYSDADDSAISLPEIPVLTGWEKQEPEERAVVEDGCYSGMFVKETTITKDGREILFASGDTPSKNGDSRNISFQTVLTRKSDGMRFTKRFLINYRSSDFTAESLSQLVEGKAAMAKARETGGSLTWKDLGLFRLYQAVSNISTLAALAGVPQLRRAVDGGFDLTPLFGKSAYFHLGDESANRAAMHAGAPYKEIKDFSIGPPKRKPVL